MLHGLFIFFLAACFYLYDFVLQVAPSVMATPIMQAFDVSARGFGLISAFYFYAYAPMQLPAGVLYDRYGPRRVMTTAVLICALGSLFFALTESVLAASLGRFMIGFGSAFSFVGVLILIARWFPERYFALLAGIAQSMSSVGAIFGEAPLAALIKLTSWRQASFILSVIGFGLTLLFWLFIRDYPHQQTQSAPKTKLFYEWRRLHAVCRHAHTWYTGAYAFTTWTPIAVFAALWGVPFLEAKYQISVIAASAMCSMIWVGIGVGSPLLGWLSDYLKSRRMVMVASGSMGLIACLLILYTPNVSQGWMYGCLLLLGLGASGQIVSFAVVKDNNPPHLVGSASGFNNMAILIGGAIFQPIVGFILHHSDEWVMINNAPIYSVNAYQNALLVMPICYLLSVFIALFLIKESFKKKEHVIK
ncbi:MFS transporter [Legionella impletisoli]|uniref:Lysosomal dipeptide transporter MFSD1 n=1 Tax=Legionella impletisoli TaxID=343510 RepID=A0A917K014_9GAMM|nr:MFS transporter [Legionella impletisoli]GGI92595.1 MFS transporter [Legionella impletisoli]